MQAVDQELQKFLCVLLAVNTPFLVQSGAKFLQTVSSYQQKV